MSTSSSEEYEFEVSSVDSGTSRKLKKSMDLVRMSFDKATNKNKEEVEMLTKEESFHPRLEALPKASMEISRVFQEVKQREQIKIEKKKRKRGIKGYLDKRKEKKEQKARESSKSRINIDEHQLSFEELATRLDTNLNFTDLAKSPGLTAQQAEDKFRQNGPNQLTPTKVKPMWLKFLLQFIGFFPLLLEIGGILCLIAYGLDSSTNDNLYLGVILWLVVIITAIFSFMQEAKSAGVMEGFKKLAPQKCKVRRGGKTLELDVSQLVIGDVVELKAGDKVPADLRLLWVNDLKVDNSSLTGESELQGRSEKCTDENYLETKNLAFFTTLAQEGDGVGVVIRTGDNTVIGNIAHLASSTGTEQTPLGKEIGRFIKIVSVVAIGLGIIFLIVGAVVGLDWIPNVVFVIGIIVANVPEGLLPTVTLALTLTAKRLAKKNVWAKNLEAVETLGSCSTIASDKTGTLTQNRMTVVHVFYDEEICSCDDIATRGAFKPEDESFQALLRVAMLNNRAVFEAKDENLKLPINDRKTVGDASESALLKFAEPLQPVMEYRAANPKVFEIPFNSVNKWQLSIHLIADEHPLLLMKGAPERVIDRCSYVLEQGKKVELTEKYKQIFNKAYETLAGNGERVLGFAQLELDRKTFTPDYHYNVEKENFPTDGLTFVGLMALMDPPRPSVPDSVAQCKLAGIRVIMVTGDHPLTAEAIAKQVGIITGTTMNSIAKERGISLREVPDDAAEAVVIKGSEIPELSTEDWDKILQKRQIVFARTSPEQKLQIVEQCQKRGEIVAVTGDGVNDSPALKKADLGCAMGIAGSDVSKEAADVVLLDDNFASIVAGVREGRIIFDNLKKSIAYTLSSNSAELVPFIFFAVIQLPLALSAVLILCIDLGTDMIPAISLAYEKPESDIMSRKPRDPKKDRLVTLKLAIYSYLWLGTIQAVAGFIGYFVTMNDYGFAPGDLLGKSFDYFKSGAEDLNGYSASKQIEILREAQTSFFVAVVVTRIACVLVCKTRTRSIFQQGFRNMVLNSGVLFEIVLAVFLTYFPWIHDVFGTANVSYKIWLIGLPFFAFTILTDELRKYLIRKYPSSKFKKYTYW